MKLRSKFAFATAFASAAISAQAASVLIINHSFESPTLADVANTNSGAGTGVFNGWNYVTQNGASFEDFGIENPGGGAYTGAAGNGTLSGANGINVAYLNQDNSGLFTGIFQNVGSLQANTQYTMTIAVGQRLDRVNGSVEFGLYGATTGATNIWSTGTVLSTATNVSTTNGTFQDFSVTFTTGAVVSNDLYVAARFTETGANLIQASLDNVRLDAVPEPSVALLGGLGMVGLLRRRRVS
ncbi:MAG: PEP-CTERM sorting domain-containing protein [Luteolibacter sp.]